MNKFCSIFTVDEFYNYKYILYGSKTNTADENI